MPADAFKTSVVLLKGFYSREIVKDAMTAAATALPSPSRRHRPLRRDPMHQSR